jgi:hypothetical protein
MPKSNFSMQVDEWFSRLSEFGNETSELKDQIVELSSANIPNRRRLDKMILLLEQLPATPQFVKLITQANAIITGDYSGRGKEFKFAYNRVSRFQGQCSATSEFFSMIRQAITYNDK